MVFLGDHHRLPDRLKRLPDTSATGIPLDPRILAFRILAIVSPCWHSTAFEPPPKLRKCLHSNCPGGNSRRECQVGSHFGFQGHPRSALRPELPAELQVWAAYICSGRRVAARASPQRPW